MSKVTVLRGFLVDRVLETKFTDDDSRTKVKVVVDDGQEFWFTEWACSVRDDHDRKRMSDANSIGHLKVEV